MNFARYWEMARIELRSEWRKPLFWMLLFLVLLMTASLNSGTLIPSGDDSVGGVQPQVNSAYALAQSFTMVGFFVYAFFAALMAGFVVLRDDEVEISDLLHSTPLTPREYILGKFTGVLLALGTVLLIHLLFVVWLYQLAPLASPELRGVFKVSHYLVPALAMTAPLILFSAGLGFAVGEWTRKPVLVFLVPTALLMSSIFFFWTWEPIWLDESLNRWIMIFDPSGIRWLVHTFFKIDRGIDFYDTSPLLLDGTFWLNRLWNLVVPSLALFLSIQHCRKLCTGQLAQVKKNSAASTVSEKPRPAISYRPLAETEMEARAPRLWPSIWQMARSDLKEIWSQPTLYLFILLMISLTWEAATSVASALDAPVILTSGTLAVSTIGMVTLSLCLLLLVSTVESFHREKTTGFAEIFYATPIKNLSIILSKNLVNLVNAAVILFFCGFFSLAMMALQGQGKVEVWPLVLVWGLLLFPTVLVWSAFVTAVTAIFHDRYLAYTIGLIALAGSAYHQTQESMSWLYNWNLWNALRWSDLGTFTLNGEALMLNRLLVTSLALFLIALTVRLFARVDRDAMAWSSQKFGRFRKEALRLAPFLLLTISIGVILVWKLDAGFQSDEAKRKAKDYWRQNVATWKDFDLPTLTHVDLEIELEPSQRRMEVQGHYRMVNDTDRALAHLPFTVSPSFEKVTWKLGDSAIPFENRSGLHVLKSSVPIAPGERFRVGFSYSAIVPKGLTKNGGGIGQFILPSGTVLHSLGSAFIPRPGFLESIGIDPENQHEPADPSAEFAQYRASAAESTKPFMTRIQVTAPSEYTVNSVGRKTAEEKRDGRTTVTWESDYPVKAINLVAGRWEESRRGGTAVFYHPEHAYNSEEILQTLIAARERYSDWFYPYPWSELKLSEFPDYVRNAQAFPTHISFSEGIGFLARQDPEVQLAFTVTAHEAAHQWWGHLLTPGTGPGTDVLVEGMAHYSALLLHESEQGLQGRMAFARRMEDSYLQRRRIDGERPLLEVLDDGHPATETVIYDKGAWVMWMLHQHLGRRAMLAGLQDFIVRFLDHPKAPDLTDLIEILAEQTQDPEAYRAFIDQWFGEVVVPEFRIQPLKIEEGKQGGFEISAMVENVGTGAVTVEVAAVRGSRFSGPSSDQETAYREVRTSARLLPGQPQRVDLVTSFEPREWIVDPDVKVLQRRRDKAKIDIKPSSSVATTVPGSRLGKASGRPAGGCDQADTQL